MAGYRARRLSGVGRGVVRLFGVELVDEGHQALQILQSVAHGVAFYAGAEGVDAGVLVDAEAVFDILLVADAVDLQRQLDRHAVAGETNEIVRLL